MRFGLLIFFCGLMVACNTAQFAPSQLNQNYAQRTPPEMIEIFRSTKPAKAYFEIGAITNCCSMNGNALIGPLRQEAAARGGDALVDLDLNAAGGLTATVIRYK